MTAKVRIVPASALSSKSLRASDYLRPYDKSVPPEEDPVLGVVIRAHRRALALLEKRKDEVHADQAKALTTQLNESGVVVIEDRYVWKEDASDADQA